MPTSRFLEPEKWEREQVAPGRERVTPLEQALKARANEAKKLDPLIEKRAKVAKRKDAIYATIKNPAITDDEVEELRNEIEKLSRSQFHLTSTIEFHNNHVLNADRRVRSCETQIKAATDEYVMARTDEHDNAQRLANAKLDEAQRLRDRAQNQVAQRQYEANRLREERTDSWGIRLDEGVAEKLAVHCLASVKDAIETAEEDARTIEGYASSYIEKNEQRQRETAKHLLFLGREAAIERAEALVVRRRAE